MTEQKQRAQVSWLRICLSQSWLRAPKDEFACKGRFSVMKSWRPPERVLRRSSKPEQFGSVCFAFRHEANSNVPAIACYYLSIAVLWFTALRNLALKPLKSKFRPTESYYRPVKVAPKITLLHSQTRTPIRYFSGYLHWFEQLNPICYQ